MQERLEEGQGLYLHIPFCLKKCSYCDFYSLPASSAIIDRYGRALEKELAFKALSYGSMPVNTLYLGGGTPSLLSAQALGSIMDSIKACWELDEQAEISLEANPATLDEGRLQSIREAGFNRISLGVQSFQDQELKILGRSHSAQDARDSIEMIKDSGLSNFNLDLIYGIPGQTISKWQENLAQALGAEPAHISVYLLQLDEQTPLARDIRSGYFQLSSEDREAEMYDLAVKMIEEAGLVQYELSNFARPGQECRHNLGYWRAREYVGIGAGAVSFKAGGRFLNQRNLVGYLEKLEKEQEPETEELERMERAELAADAIILGLRLCEGINLEDFVHRYGINILEHYRDIVEEYTGRQLLTLNNGWLRLSRQAYFVSNQVICHFMPDLES